MADKRSPMAEAYRHWYKTAQWQAKRRAILIRDNYQCRECSTLVGIRKYDAHVDHIKPHKGNASLFWSDDNLQVLCANCHNRHKQSFERTGRKPATFTPDGQVIW